MILNFKKGTQILGKKIADLDAVEPTPPRPSPRLLLPSRRWPPPFRPRPLKPPSPRHHSPLKTGGISW